VLKSLTNKYQNFIAYINCILLSLLFFSFPAFSDRSGIYHVLSLCLLIVSLGCFIFQVFLLKNGSFNFPIVSLLVFGFVVLLSSLANDPSQLNSTPFSMILLFCVLDLFFSSRILDMPKTLLSLIVGGLAFCLYYFWQYHSYVFSLNFDRVGEDFANVNRLGNFFSITICFCMIFLLFFKTRTLFEKSIAILTMILSFFLCLFTGSRTALLENLLLLLLFLLFSVNKKNFWVFPLLIFGLAILLFSLSFVPALEPIYSRFSQFFSFAKTGEASADGSTSERIAMFFQGLSLFSQKPFLGFGLNGFANNGVFGTYSHNTISELLCDFGIFGLLSFEAASLWPFLFIFKKNQLFSKVLFLIFPILFLMQISFPVFVNKTYCLLLAFLSGNVSLFFPDDSFYFFRIEKKEKIKKI
jgi:O-antigen ligase